MIDVIFLITIFLMSSVFLGLYVIYKNRFFYALFWPWFIAFLPLLLHVGEEVLVLLPDIKIALAIILFGFVYINVWLYSYQVVASVKLISSSHYIFIIGLTSVLMFVWMFSKDESLIFILQSVVLLIWNVVVSFKFRKFLIHKNTIFFQMISFLLINLFNGLIIVSVKDVEYFFGYIVLSLMLLTITSLITLFDNDRKNYLKKVNHESQMHKRVLERKYKNLIAQQKLNSFGIVASNVAHEFKNPFNLISNASEMIQQSVSELRVYWRKNIRSLISEDESMKIDYNFEFLDQGAKLIDHNVDRVDLLIKGLLGRTRMERSKKDSIILRDLLNQIVSKFQRIKNSTLIKQNVVVQMELNGNSHLECYPEEFESAIVSILDNSYKTLESKFNKDQTFNPLIKIDLSELDGYFHLIFWDNGEGIEQYDIDKILMENFIFNLSTKKGLGLTVSKDIINQHLGELSIESSIGQFTKISIILPISEFIYEANE